jgi:hypothetical protein
VFMTSPLRLTLSSYLGGTSPVPQKKCSSNIFLGQFSDGMKKTLILIYSTHAYTKFFLLCNLDMG